MATFRRKKAYPAGSIDPDRIFEITIEGKPFRRWGESWMKPNGEIRLSFNDGPTVAFHAETAPQDVHAEITHDLSRSMMPHPPINGVSVERVGHRLVWEKTPQGGVLKYRGESYEAPAAVNRTMQERNVRKMALLYSGGAIRWSDGEKIVRHRMNIRASTADETTDCPECGTPVPILTGWCVTCEQKVLGECGCTASREAAGYQPSSHGQYGGEPSGELREEAADRIKKALKREGLWRPFDWEYTDQSSFDYLSVGWAAFDVRGTTLESVTITEDVTEGKWAVHVEDWDDGVLLVEDWIDDLRTAVDLLADTLEPYMGETRDASRGIVSLYRRAVNAPFQGTRTLESILSDVKESLAFHLADIAADHGIHAATKRAGRIMLTPASDVPADPIDIQFALIDREVVAWIDGRSWTGRDKIGFHQNASLMACAIEVFELVKDDLGV